MRDRSERSRKLFVLRAIDRQATVIGVFKTLGELVLYVANRGRFNTAHIQYRVCRASLEIQPAFPWWHIIVEDHTHENQINRRVLIVTKEIGRLRTSDVLSDSDNRAWHAYGQAYPGF